MIGVKKNRKGSDLLSDLEGNRAKVISLNFGKVVFFIRPRLILEGRLFIIEEFPNTNHCWKFDDDADLIGSEKTAVCFTIKELVKLL